MATRQQVLALLARGYDYPRAGAELGVPAGQAYLTATGRPADGSGTAADVDADRPGILLTSSQQLTNPPAANPTADPTVHAWIRRRAGELRQPPADGR
ncbi:hypothetical protein Daura_32335 [Dactylosporangium aurantiacum]|uniref:Uncharacterized protein n=1 Tax=Dactylosporangium aurantiacum TaxID=35754 RepID=A0A9Q9IBN0_9ACTN|nr:hypothetical protein [Dactylosporangium aurantiacum]MDG6107129.1 hypothetical protein [Dactylosporangium aurantiacum]UWZ51425.1 hypothetical protein Daura_32335 [Dactylosporangium aurantiacum]